MRARTIRWFALWFGLWAAFAPGLGVALAAPAPAMPVAVQGVLDLRQWDLARDGPVRLDGEWSFYWDQSRQSLAENSPRETIKVPGHWLQNGHPAQGKAVYRLRILTQPGSHVFGLKLYEFPHSYRLYANGRQIIENGQYAETPSPSGRSLVRPYVVFAATGDAVDLLIESANLDDAEPGPRRSLIFGLESQVRKVQDNQLIADVMVTGVLLIMALYHLALYLQRRSEMGSLLFGLLCVLMIVRIAVTEEHYLHKYFPQFPGGIERTLDVFSFFAMVPMFTWIFSYFFRQEFHPWVHKSVTTVFLLFSAVYLLAPSAALFVFYLWFTLVVALYLLFVLLRGVKHRHAESGVFLLGFLLLAATSVWDMLSYSNIVRTVYISHFGFIAFIFAQAYALSMRFNQALFTSEKLTLNLESVVAERTSALEESNRRLALLNITDALTGIANRRHFDDMLYNEWSRAQRNQRPLALLMLDIDNFKAYNDHYGHQGGDVCLKTVAQILSATIHRAGDTLARYGGEEFVALLPEFSAEEALQLAEKARLEVEAAAMPQAVSLAGVVTISIGVVSLVPTQTDTAEQLLKFADDALYQAKRQGRNRVVLARLT